MRSELVEPFNDAPARFEKDQIANDGFDYTGTAFIPGKSSSQFTYASTFNTSIGITTATVHDAKGRLRHDGGVTGWPGLYVTGLPVLRRRRSTFIDGAAADALDITTHLAGHLDEVARLDPTRRSAS